MPEHRFEPPSSCVASVQEQLFYEGMTPDEIKKVREELACTARELATALGLEQDIVLAWEKGELFPTKRYVVKMEELRRKGPSAIPRKPRRQAAAAAPMAVLSDPELWRLVRKLIAHTELRREAIRLAETYSDPGEETS
jgi:DNA-binding transcriptional regulator YiaG